MPEQQSVSPAPVTPVFDPAWTMVKQSWKWYNDHLKTLLQLSFIAVIPSLIFQIILSATQESVPEATNLSLGLTISFGLGFFLWSVLNIFWSILGTIAIYLYLRQPDQTKTAWQQFIGAQIYVINYFSTSIIYGLIIFGGLILLVVPGIIWAIMFSLAPIIAVFEKASASNALSRSKALIKGHWWDVFWRGLLLGLTIAAISIIGAGVFTAFNFIGNQTVVSDLLGVVLNACLTPLPLILTYLIYTKLSKKA